MNKPIEIIRAKLLEKFPKSRLTQLSAEEKEKLIASYPGLPDSYWNFLTEIGWGSIGDGNYSVYSCPFEPEEIFGEEGAKELPDVLLVGDDFSGGHEAFKKENGNWEFVSFDHCYLDELLEEKREFPDYIYERFVGENE